MPMVQAYAHELLNQKESQNGTEAGYPSDMLFSATERLLSALDRLENNLGRQLESFETMPEQAERLNFFERENAELRQERENLSAALAEMEQQYSDLQRVAGTIYRKLNSSIKRLTNIMGD